MSVNSKMVQLETSQLSCKFCEKNKYSKQAIVIFLRAQGIIYHTVTHEFHNDPNESKELSLDFILAVCPIFNQNNHPPRYLYNCDQSGIMFTPSMKKTLENQGAKSVTIYESNSDTICELWPP